MSLGAKFINFGMKMSGAKKMYSLPEDEFIKKIEKLNESRGFFMPTDNKGVYKEHHVLGNQVLIMQKSKEPSKTAILFFFGGGMIMGSDKGDVDVIQKLMNATGCDIWFPMYPLCIDHCITDAYEMAHECYRQMIDIYGAGNVSTCGFSSGGALALGVATYNNAHDDKLPMPRHIVAVSPGEIPWNDSEREIMKKNNPKDMMVDYAFMEKVEKFMKHGRTDIPDYMLMSSKGDFTGVSDISFYWSEDEVLYGAKQNYIDVCEKYKVKYSIKTRPGMIHCYPMLPYFKEAKEDFAEIAAYLAS